MSRLKAGLGAAAALLVLLGWIWPEGSEPAGPQAAAPPASGAPTDGGPDGGGTESQEGPRETGSPSAEGEAPTTPAADESAPAAAEPAANTFGGPLGTRDRTGTEAVALTFDDGPDPKWTPRVLDELRERGVKATFCVIGAYAEANPALIADIARDGHTLCNHSWFHEIGLGRWSEAEIEANLRRTNDAIERAAPGVKVAHFRQPGGMWTERAIRVAADLGMESVHWAVDPSDWDDEATASRIRERVMDEVGPGAIVLLHDGGANQRDMLAALRSILDGFDRRGYRLAAL